MSDDGKRTQNEIDLRDKAVEINTDGNGPKAARFLTGDRDPALTRKRETDTRRNHLMQIHTQQMASAEQVNAVRTLLTNVQDTLDEAILDIADRIEDMEAGAAKLEDGSPVFQAADGSFYRADGTKVPADQAPTNIPPGAASWEEYQAAKKRAAELAAIQTDIIDSAREKLESDDLTEEEVKTLEEELRKAEQTIEHENTAQDTPQAEARKDIANTVAQRDLGAAIPSL